MKYFILINNQVFTQSFLILINTEQLLCLFLSDFLGDVRVTTISNAEDTDTEELTASSSEFDVVTSVVVDADATQHGVVFDFRTTERRAVGADDDELSCKKEQKYKKLCGKIFQ